MDLNLKKEWLQLTALYNTNVVLAEKNWQMLEQAYTARGRHYHSLQHIHDLLMLARAHQASIEDPDALRFAIFFHDAVYNPLRKDNEERSAGLAVEKLQHMGLPPARLQRVCQMILATKAHSSSADADTSLFQDFDLSILGSDWEMYQNYARQIREEYRLIPWFLYKKGRKQVLQHFLALPRIYKTKAFYQQLEAAARHNMELEQLALK